MRFCPPALGAVSLLALALTVPATAQVSGKLVLGAYKPASAPVKRPAYNWELENGFKEVKPDRVDARRELAVVLLGPGEPKGMERVEVAFEGGGLLPSTIAVRTGTTLLVRNDDECAHEVFAKGLAGFTAEAIAPRGRRSVSLKDAGSWALGDQVIPHVSGQLYVLADLMAVATVEADGSYAFKDVPPGKYVLKVLRGAKELASQDVELGSRPLSVNPVALTDSAADK